MTKLLQQAIAAVSKLPEELQDAIARHLLTELKEGQAWQGRFEAKTNSQWDNLATLVGESVKTEEESLETESQDNRWTIFSSQTRRDGWSEAFALMASNQDDVLLDNANTTDWDQSEWEW